MKDHANKPIENISIDISFAASASVAISCDYDGARFHLWIDTKTLQPVDDRIYKNPPQGSTAFNTRTLRQDRGIGKMLTDAMLPKAHELYQAARIALQERLAQRQAAAAEAARIHRIKEAGPELFAACKALVEWCDNNPPAGECLLFVEQARAAIAKATKEA